MLASKQHSEREVEGGIRACIQTYIRNKTSYLVLGIYFLYKRKAELKSGVGIFRKNQKMRGEVGNDEKSNRAGVSDTCFY